MRMAWQEISKAAQVQLLEAIPLAWRIDTSKYKHLSDVTSVPSTCGVLTESQLRITELTATEIVEKIESRQLKAVQVLEAFAGRAAIAHQLVGTLLVVLRQLAYETYRSTVSLIGSSKMACARPRN